MAASEVRLGYGLSSEPPQLAVGTPATVNVTVTNTTGTPVTCKKLTLTLAVGEGGEAFTTKADAAIIKVIFPQDGWSRQTHTEDNVLVLVPGRKVQKIEDELVFGLIDVKVNNTPGQAELTIVEETTAEARTIRRHTKFSGGFTLGEFLPKAPSVRAGEEVELTWQCDNHKDEKLFLHWSEGPAEGRDVSRDKSTRVTIWRDTAFRLSADQGGVTYALSTFITVQEPHLVVHKLISKGPCVLWQRPSPGTMPPLIPPPNTLGSWVRHYTATSDGLLDGSVQTFRSSAQAGLRITVRPPAGAEHGASARAAGDCPDGYDPGRQVAVPVPCGSRVTVDWDLKDTGPQPSPHRAVVPALTWHSWGTGVLVPDATDPR
ncbi:hypothetical protein [Streptomyces sp. NBC_01477]|uniref:hypothetical protein n=1 Tax=Streptomyces sp. NBC_01477 TaxID=2976015 RepID=UPI002E3411BF|nr:hypothetical protein [Streptomyces sp. NBC_01477]